MSVLAKREGVPVIAQDFEIIVQIAYRWRGDHLSTHTDFGRYPVRTFEEIEQAVADVSDRIVKGVRALPEWDRIISAALNTAETAHA